MEQLIEFFTLHHLDYKVVEHLIDKKVIKYIDNKKQYSTENDYFYYIYFSKNGRFGELRVNCINDNTIIIIKSMIINDMLNKGVIYSKEFTKIDNKVQKGEINYFDIEKFKEQYIVAFTQCTHTIKVYFDQKIIQELETECYLEVVTYDYKQFFYHLNNFDLCYKQFLHDNLEFNYQQSIIIQNIDGAILMKKEVMVLFISCLLNTLNSDSIIYKKSIFTMNDRKRIIQTIL